ncbi:MAG: TonB-dependent receptor [Acidobacteria bacterium]|nr:TonB-dependent receptor [Acidobacteriota bacterium]
MKFRVFLAVMAILLLSSGRLDSALGQAVITGVIKGHVRLNGELSGNPVIRMSRDPMCAKLNAGKQVVQETVMASLDGSLADVFVRLQGTFPQTAVPTTPVVIDQRGCVYRPRVIGMRVGQTLQIKNSDNFLHNVHSVSKGSSNFNIGQPVAGVVYSFKPKAEEVMLRLQCDLHSWMTAFVGIVSNPYFAVTPASGNFQIDKVPTGTYTVQAWQEQYGFVSKTVTVKAGATSTVDFTYSAAPAPATRGPARQR